MEEVITPPKYRLINKSILIEVLEKKGKVNFQKLFNHLVWLNKEKEWGNPKFPEEWYI